MILIQHLRHRQQKHLTRKVTQKMPHIVLEYSQHIEDEIDVPALLTSMHDALANEGVDKSRIKTRGVLLAHSVVGNDAANAGQMAHITLLLLEGRDEATKKQYSVPLHQIAKDMITAKFPDCAVTLEVRDMEQATYIL